LSERQGTRSPAPPRALPGPAAAQLAAGSARLRRSRSRGGASRTKAPMGVLFAFHDLPAWPCKTLLYVGAVLCLKVSFCSLQIFLCILNHQ